MLEHGATAFDAIRTLWGKNGLQHKFFVVLVIFFIFGGLCIVLNHFELLPPTLAAITPKASLQAVHLAFTLVLAMEVIDLVFCLADSVSRMVGKQLEIMSLILLRDAFKDIGELRAPLSWNEDYFAILQVCAVILGALALFVVRGKYFSIRRMQNYITDETRMRQYIVIKKFAALILLTLIIGIGARDIYATALGIRPSLFFQHLYNTLIFMDVLMVLIGQCFMPSFHATFRNSGYAAATLIMRIALGAPHIIAAALCIFAALFVLALTWATNYFPPERFKN